MTDRAKISKRAVDAAKPCGRRYVLWDTEIPGFGMRVSAAGAKSYVYRYRVGGGRSGRERWVTIGKHGVFTPDAARDVARQLAADAAVGGDPASARMERRTAPTVSEVLDRYLSEHVERKNKASTAAEVRRQIEGVIRPALGSLKVADVTRADLARFHAGMANTPYAANRALALLSKAFSLAELWGYRPEHSNPCNRVQRFKEQPRDRFLKREEFARLGEVLARAETGSLAVEGKPRPVRINPQAIIALRLLIFTGARVSEILGLRWEWVDFDLGRAVLPDSKSGRKHLHLPPAAMEVLDALDQPNDEGGFVVRGGDGSDPETPLVNLKDPWRHIRKVADLEDVRLHDLRHSFASTAVEHGMSLTLIGALLGHRDVKTTARYAHVADDPLREAASGVGRRISDALRGADSGAEVVPLRRK